MSLDIHGKIINRLDTFIENGSIPNIIFHGPVGSGKRTIVNSFISKIYNNDWEAKKSYVLTANCAHVKGIKFIREDLKTFAKTRITLNSINCFKTIVLSNADSLTIDAQSALRRCIEQFSYNTRFFIIINDKSRLLKPIISRFCEIYIPYPIINNTRVNLHTYQITNCYGDDRVSKTPSTWIKKNMTPLTVGNYVQIMSFADKMYERGYSGLDLLRYIEHDNSISSTRRALLLITFHKVKAHFRNERLYILFMVNFILIRSDEALENVSFM